MPRSPIVRLRLAFVLLGMALLAPLALILRSAEARIERQRRLRHETVAERIFDEMESELTGLIEREAARPSAAYQASSTRADSWAPFVVGYFRSGPSGVQLLASEQLSLARRQRAGQALGAALGLTHAASMGSSGVAGDTDSGRAFPKEQVPQGGGLAGLEGISEQAASDTKVGGAVAPERSGLATGAALKRPTSTKSRARIRRGTKPRAKQVVASPAPSASAPSGVEQDTIQVLRQLNRAAKKRKSTRSNSPSKAPLSAEDVDPLSGLEP